MEILSPLTQTTDVSLEKEIDKSSIIQAYNHYGIDVSNYFKELNKVSIYRCNETGYRFYYPLHLWGDSKFYEHFQQFDWYYMPWKWEHETTRSYLKPEYRILEVGCAHGAFISRVTEELKLKNTVGLELNESAVHKSDNWEIRNELIQDFATSHAEQFDLVCSFQVLEHIADVRSFLKASVACLKPNGKLIVSVPNNRSFIKDENGCLNMPPHHMGLWDDQSLSALETILPVRVIATHIEELQEYHVAGYVHSHYYASYPKIVGKMIRKLHKLTGTYGKRYEKTMEARAQLTGHTILVAYEKISPGAQEL